MAEVVDEVPKTRRPRYRYPWDVWLDGQTRRLVPGEDFTETMSPYSFIAGARVYAERRGIKIHAVVRDGDVYLRAKTDE